MKWPVRRAGRWQDVGTRWPFPAPSDRRLGIRHALRLVWRRSSLGLSLTLPRWLSHLLCPHFCPPSFDYSSTKEKTNTFHSDIPFSHRIPLVLKKGVYKYLLTPRKPERRPPTSWDDTSGHVFPNGDTNTSPYRHIFTIPAISLRSASSRRRGVIVRANVVVTVYAALKTPSFSILWLHVTVAPGGESTCASIRPTLENLR